MTSAQLRPDLPVGSTKATMRWLTGSRLVCSYYLHLTPTESIPIVDYATNHYTNKLQPVKGSTNEMNRSPIRMKENGQLSELPVRYKQYVIF